MVALLGTKVMREEEKKKGEGQERVRESTLSLSASLISHPHTSKNLKRRMMQF